MGRVFLLAESRLWWYSLKWHFTYYNSRVGERGIEGRFNDSLSRGVPNVGDGWDTVDYDISSVVDIG